MLNYKIKNNLLNEYHNLFSENLNLKLEIFISERVLAVRDLNKET